MRSPRRTLGSAVVSIEAFVVFFAGLVAKDLSSLSSGRALGLFSALAVGCVLTAGLLGRPWGYAFGWVVQGAVVGGAALSRAARIEREREAYAREHGA